MDPKPRVSITTVKCASAHLAKNRRFSVDSQVSMFLCMYRGLCTCVYMYICICVYTYMYIECIYIYIYILKAPAAGGRRILQKAGIKMALCNG